MLTSLPDISIALNSFDLNKRIYMDTETISFDDEQEAFKPYHGHRVSLAIIGQLNDNGDKNIITIPLRHRTEVGRCVNDLDGTKELLGKWASNVKILANANVKFDMHMAGQDGIEFDNATIEDTLVLARLVYNEHMSYSLKSLCNHYKVACKEDTEVKEWLDTQAKNGTPTKDYGKIPFSILEPYGVADVVANIELHELLLKLLPVETQVAWDIEKRLTPWLYRSEKRGILIDEKFLLKKKLEYIKDLLHLSKQIQELSGGAIDNPSSSVQIGSYFESLGILSNKKTKPTKKLPNGGPSWDKDVLYWIASLGQDTPHKVAGLLHKFGTEELAESTFCTGWLGHIDANKCIHGNTKQAGTVSGRSSSEKPNLQNPPKWIYEAILIPKGRVGIAWDLSQIEYRLFAHYANDPDIIAKYRENPKTDYHQILADKLGIPRDPTKRINFGILYGMGKAKTTTNIRSEIIAFENNPKNDIEAKTRLREHMYGAYYDPLEEVPPLEVQLPQEALVHIAKNILSEYHELNPVIKNMQKQIKQLLGVRGYIKTYYGMHAYLGLDRAYVGLNRLIQGSAAHLFKKKMHDLMQACREANLDVELDLQIHDAVYADMPLEQANAYIALAQKIVSDCPFRVPVLMDFELALYNWKNKIKISKDTDCIQEVGKLCYFK